MRSKANPTFLSWANRKYRKEFSKSSSAIVFYTFDDYILWLFYTKCEKDEERYYQKLEKDFKDYADNQKGAKD